MKKFLQEFKAFATRGNVIGLAVGVMIGGAFQNLVTSFINYILSPILGILPKNDLNHWVTRIFGSEIMVGAFLSALINFIVMALVIFLMVKGVNALMDLRKKEETAAPTTKVCPFCKTEIDLQATRCPHCTSVLEDSPAEEA